MRTNKAIYKAKSEEEKNDLIRLIANLPIKLEYEGKLRIEMKDNKVVIKPTKPNIITNLNLKDEKAYALLIRKTSPYFTTFSYDGVEFEINYVTTRGAKALKYRDDLAALREDIRVAKKEYEFNKRRAYFSVLSDWKFFNSWGWSIDLKQKQEDILKEHGFRIPTWRKEVKKIFEKIAEVLGFHINEENKKYPEFVLWPYGGRERIRATYEQNSLDFIKKKKDPSLCDLIICWENGLELSPISILELKTFEIMHRNNPNFERYRFEGNVDKKMRY